MSKREVCDSTPAIAYYGGLNGVVLYSIEHGIDDYIYCLSGAMGGCVQYHRVKIRYNSTGPYILLYNHRVRMNDCIRAEV